jgi:hypothetical protein
LITKLSAFLRCTVIVAAVSLVAGTAHSFSLLDPSTWLPASFSATNPDSWPFIPIPEVATDPNGGTTIGMLAAVLGTDQKHEITSIMAPDLNWNTTMGPGATFRYFDYPDDDTQWFTVVGGSERIASHVEGDYGTGLTRSRWWSGEAHFLFERDPTERFFGIGNNSSFSNQSNYTTEQIMGELLFGINLAEDFQIGVDVRPRWVRIQHGAFSNLPSLGTLFPNVKGIDGGSVLRNRLIATYDSRDSMKVPTRGTFFSFYGGFADRAFGSSVSFTEFGFEARHYWQLNSRMILASHLNARYVPAGNETPFWEMSWLGGDGSGEVSDFGVPLGEQSTWRGYGAGRYIDNNLAVGSLEVRTRVYEKDIFNTHGILEVAPFVDLGQVFHNASSNPVRIDALHPAGGVGFRAIALPFVVGYVDFGAANDGLAVFSGVNYPF